MTARSRHRWTVITNRFEPENTFPDLRRANIVELPQVSVKRSFSHVAAAGVRIAFQALPLDGVDVLVVMSEGLGDFVLCRNARVPAACICLTPLRAAFDTHYQDNYLRMHGNQWWRGALLRGAGAAYRIADRVAWRRYRRVFAISGEVRRRILSSNLCPEDKVEVLYPGVDVDRYTPTGGSEMEFLIPGRIMWTKNLTLGIQAFRLLLQRRPDLARFRLTIAGIVDRKSRDYAESLRRLADGCEQIRFIEHPSDEEMLSLYRSAYAVLYPPFNEDWGLVPVESMACGKPVIGLRRGGPCESILDGETGFLAEPTPESFAMKMEQLADNEGLVRRMGIRARQRALEFGWKGYCERIDSYLEDLAGSN